MKKKIIVIGGGASGMVAAITAARNNSQVTLLEQKSELGKKILVTGNGRCNFTNNIMQVDCYYCKDKEFIANIIESYPTKKITDFFHELGVLNKERNGYIYPLTDQATTIRDALVNELKKLKIQIVTNAQVIKIIDCSSDKKIKNTRKKECTCKVEDTVTASIKEPLNGS